MSFFSDFWDRLGEIILLFEEAGDAEDEGVVDKDLIGESEAPDVVKEALDVEMDKPLTNEGGAVEANGEVDDDEGRGEGVDVIGEVLKGTKSPEDRETAGDVPVEDTEPIDARRLARLEPPLASDEGGLKFSASVFAHSFENKDGLVPLFPLATYDTSELADNIDSAWVGGGGGGGGGGDDSDDGVLMDLLLDVDDTKD